MFKCSLFFIVFDCFRRLYPSLPSFPISNQHWTLEGTQISQVEYRVSSPVCASLVAPHVERESTSATASFTWPNFGLRSTSLLSSHYPFNHPDCSCDHQQHRIPPESMKESIDGMESRQSLWHNRRVQRSGLFAFFVL
jgi:hypothetical protein